MRQETKAIHLLLKLIITTTVKEIRSTEIGSVSSRGGGEIITIFRGQVDFGYFWGADSENHTHFGWKSIFSLLPLCTKLAEMPQNRHFCGELVLTVLWLFLGFIWVSFIKRPPNRPLMISQALDEVWGLVLVRTGLAKIIKIDKIWNTVFSVFFALF